jgi:integrase
MKLTDLKIKNLKLKQKSYKVGDGKGLYLFIMKSGGKSWRYDYKLKIGIDTYKNRTFVYGLYPEISLAEARETHTDIKRLISKGIDPNAHKKEQERIALLNVPMCFEEISLLWLEKKRLEVNSETLIGIQKRLETYLFPKIGNIPLNELATSDFLAFLKGIEERGTYELLYRLRQYCSQILRYAVAHGKIERDFTVDIKEAFAVRSVKHQPALQPEEITEFLKALNYNEPRLYAQTRLALKMLMLTFVRPIELASAEWNEFNFVDNRWIIPAEKMKMKLDHIVPLSNQTLIILDTMRPVTGDYQYVFIKQRKPKEHMSRDTLSKAVRSLGFQGRHTAHGFRALARTTIREKLNWDSEIIERQLAHTPNTSLGRTYDRTQFLEQRTQMMQEWADYLDKNNCA